jgi:hypothetical protein
MRLAGGFGQEARPLYRHSNEAVGIRLGQRPVRGAMRPLPL